MRASRVYEREDLVNRHTPSLGSKSPESSTPASPESTFELETISKPESEEGDIESHLHNIASGEEVNGDPLSLAWNKRGSEDDDGSDEDQAFSHTSNEQAVEDVDLDNLGHLLNVEPNNRKTVDKKYARILGKLKSEIYNTITISDDRSAGSKFEERNLLALQDRGYKAPEPKSEPVAQLRNDALQAKSEPLSQLRNDALQAKSEPLAQHNNALEDYQMQMMLLEQQNKKRLLMERYEQQSPIDVVPTSPAAMDIEAVASAPNKTALTTDLLNGVDEHTITTNLKHVLEGGDPSKLDLQKLQEYIELLQAQATHFESTQSLQAPPRYQIIYRLQRRGPVQQRNSKQKYEERYSSFFDHPELVSGQGSASHIQCKLPLTNFDLYLEKNKDISFIVYRNFDTESARIEAQASTDDLSRDKATLLPIHTSETVRPVNKDLIEATMALLKSQQEYAELLRDFSASVELPAPYLFIYHSRRSLKKFQDSIPSHAQPQISLFLHYVTEQYADEYAAADSLLSRNKISAEHLRYLFKPGDLLVSRVDGEYMGLVSKSWPRISWDKQASHERASRSQIGTSLFLCDPHDSQERMATNRTTVHVCKLNVWHWGFDGNFQRQHETLSLEIPAAKDDGDDTDINGKKTAEVQGETPKTVKGEKNISDLNVFPMQFASAEIVDKCRRRGKTFWKCRTRSYVSYQDAERDSIQNLVDERYMIDLKTYTSLHPESKLYRSSLKDELGPEALARDVPPDEQFEFLLPLKIKGYNLRRKQWFDLMADRISDVTWNKEAFQNLVIDRKARDLIRALVSNQLAAEKGTDLIMGKGNGLILLLHGGPGTGKTLTAESVAEIAEKPLYRVTCGDVGTKAEEVEKYLESVLHLGKIWGCVVLLDEADVFLEQRSLEDMDRNALVSVFLRVLEYYEGILVLTSNRVGTFDEAFRSRIQLALHYPVLGPYQRLRIWENFLNRLESFGDDKVDVADLRDHLEDLKEEKMNGRQIRNVITTARQYAEWKGSTLTYKHLSDVIEVSGRFDKYLDQLNGGFTQDQLAEDEGLRLS